MPWKLEDTKKLIAIGSPGAALDNLSILIGAYPPFIKDEFYFLYARWNGLKRQFKKNVITEDLKEVEVNIFNNKVRDLVELMEQGTNLFSNNYAKPILGGINPEEDSIHLLYVSFRRKIHHFFKISPQVSVGALKEALIKQFKIDTTTPLDSDNPETYLVVNRVPLLNEHFSLLEAGIKDEDIIQIYVKYHKKMVWSQSMPTRLWVKFIGFTFSRPSVIINNFQKGKLLSLTDDELEIEFYTYDFSGTVKNLLFDFRFIDGKTCIEFQEVVNEKGKLINLQNVKIKNNPPGAPKNYLYSID